MLFSKRPRTDDFDAAAMPHMNDIYRTAARLLGNAPGADDVVQDVYLQAWKSFDQFELGTNCRAWLFQNTIPYLESLPPEMAEPAHGQGKRRDPGHHACREASDSRAYYGRGDTGGIGRGPTGFSRNGAPGRRRRLLIQRGCRNTECSCWD